jgi:hypothetical protein
MDARVQTNLDAALDLARAGAFVFPCQSAGPNKKQPCRGVYWKSVSTRDERAIRSMWDRYPDAVPGIDLAKSGMLVIDCDRKLNDGVAWLTEHAAKFDDALDDCPITDTPSTGRHHFYKNVTPPLGNGRGQLPPKKEADVDVRGEGGFVIGPGATFTDGTGAYVGHGSILDVKEPPEWLRALLSPRTQPSPTLAITIKAEPVSDARMAAYGETALQELLADLASAPQGSRNEEANRIAFRVGQLVGGGCLTRSAALSSLEQTALGWGIPANDKALGPRGTIARALSAGEKEPRGPAEDTSPAVEILLTRDHDPETGEVIDPIESIEQPADELPDHLTHVPGLVGDITDWICDTALYPQRGLALGAALTIVGTAAGRHVAGPTRSGTHLYVVCLAPSGSGKDHPLMMIAPILEAAGMRQHIGPSQFISMPAVINFLVRSPLSVCPMDEFGAFLKRINSRRASGFEGAISGMLRTAWGASFKTMSTPEWAQRSSEMICAPAMSIYGAVTAPDFYSSLEGGDVTNGVLNRFLLIETKLRPKERPPLADPNVVPQEISDALKAIYNRNPLSTAQLCQSRQSPAFDTVPITADAEQIRRGMIDQLRGKGDADPSLEPFLARTAENAVRIATIVAVGRAAWRPQIDAQTMSWAREFAMWSSDQLAKGAGLYIADSDNQAMANSVRRAIQERGGRIKRRDLLQAMKHRYKTRELDDVIKALAESESVVIEKVVPERGGTASIFYRAI